MKRLTIMALLMFTSLLFTPAFVSAQTTTTPTATPLTIPVTGAGGGSTFAGTFTLQKFATQSGQLVATGILTGVVTSATGVATSVVQTISVPVTVGQATCQILHLDLGPLSLDLLGLRVDLSRIVLDITAQSGAGNLLGNLLCSVAGLLDNPSGLAKLLNSILAAL